MSISSDCPTHSKADAASWLAAPSSSHDGGACIIAPRACPLWYLAGRDTGRIPWLMQPVALVCRLFHMMCLPATFRRRRGFEQVHPPFSECQDLMMGSNRSLSAYLCGNSLLAKAPSWLGWCTKGTLMRRGHCIQGEADTDKARVLARDEHDISYPGGARRARRSPGQAEGRGRSCFGAN